MTGTPPKGEWVCENVGGNPHRMTRGDQDSPKGELALMPMTLHAASSMCNAARMRARQSGSPAHVRLLAKELRRTATLSERLLWSRLRGHALGGYKFRRQEPLGRYIVDFCCTSVMLIVEIDGASHLGREGDDHVRDQWLTSLGYEVLRYSAAAVEDRRERESVLQDILNHCRNRGRP